MESFAESSIKLASLVLPANSLPRQKPREIVDAAAAAGLRVVRLSSTCDLQQKADDAFAFELIEVADLLGREPVALRIESIDALIRGRSFVVTGGGGSIGSELWGTSSDASGQTRHYRPQRVQSVRHRRERVLYSAGQPRNLPAASMHQRQRRWLS